MKNPKSKIQNPKFRCSTTCPEIACEATAKVLDRAESKRAITAVHRLRDRGMETCLFGAGGTCCRNCAMGPCAIIEGVEGFEGICGATAGVVAARNFCRMIAAGAAAHVDHGREVALTFIATAKGETPYEIKDERKLHELAQVYGIKTDKDKNQLALELGEKILEEFGRQRGEIRLIRRAPQKRQEVWEKLGVIPRGTDREIVDLMHRTHMGTDQDYRNLIHQGTRCALADGWGGSMISTELQDILFGTPVPIRAKVNLGVLKEDEVNIAIHGHEPLLPEAMAIVAHNPEILTYAKNKGANGINLIGMCCSGNEILMRRGIPVAGSFLQQEVAIATGALEAMVVDVQCIMPSLPKVASCFHTKVITTSPKAKISGAIHIEFSHHNALEVATSIIKQAIDSYPNRREIYIPKEKMELIAGFSHETINHMLGGAFRASYRPLNDNIINGRIRGVAGVVGCTNPRVQAEYVHTTLVKELIANNVLVLTTGCAATTLAKEGLLIPEAAAQAGPGLREVCEAVGMPPVLHMGSCVDNSRLLISATEIVKEGGLGDDIYQIPAAGCAPEWMSEKAVAIGQYFVGSGLLVVFGTSFPTLKSKEATNFLFKEIENLYGGMWAFERDPYEIARIMIEHIDKKREALGIHKKKERVLYDMAMRRELAA